MPPQSVLNSFHKHNRTTNMADDTQNGPQTTTSSVDEQLPVGEGQNGTAPAGGTPVPDTGSAMIPPQTVGPPQMQAQISGPNGSPPQNLPQDPAEAAKAERDKQLDFHP